MSVLKNLGYWLGLPVLLILVWYFATLGDVSTFVPRPLPLVEKFASVDLHPDTLSNADMGLVFEELIRRFAELSNETAGEHYTLREVIRLMVDLLFIADTKALSKAGVVRTIYDPTAGTGGMLSIAEEYLRRLNPDARLKVFGQELNAESYAICKADMLIKGQDVSNIIFGNTILDEMEGRIRVSVVATGIDAEQMMLPEKKVTTLRTAFKAPLAKTAAPAPAPMPAPVPSPVHAQVEALAAELGAPAAVPSQAEDYILGGADAPEIPADVIPATAARYTATETVRSPAEMPLAPKPVEQKKSGWGLFGRKKAAAPVDMRAEPQTTYPKPQAQRPTNVQPMPTEKPAAPSDDLFPEHGSDEQFEIPAFLRRQAN